MANLFHRTSQNTTILLKLPLNGPLAKMREKLLLSTKIKVKTKKKISLHFPSTSKTSNFGQNLW